MMEHSTDESILNAMLYLSKLSHHHYSLFYKDGSHAIFYKGEFLQAHVIKREAK